MGLINLDPTLHDGEQIEWRHPAARSLPDRTIAGTLFLTSISILFMPNRLNRRRYIVSLRIPREQVESVDTVRPPITLKAQRNGGLRRRLRVSTSEEDHLFVINHPEHVADQIRSVLPESPEPA